MGNLFTIIVAYNYFSLLIPFCHLCLYTFNHVSNNFVDVLGQFGMQTSMFLIN